MSDRGSLTYTVGEAGKKLGLSKNVTYEAVAAGTIPSIRVGRRILIPKARLDATLGLSEPTPKVDTPEAA